MERLRLDFVPGDIVMMSPDHFNAEDCGGDMRFRLAGDTFGMKASANGSCCVGEWLVDREYCRVERWQIDLDATAALWAAQGREALQTKHHVEYGDEQ